MTIAKAIRMMVRKLSRGRKAGIYRAINHLPLGNTVLRWYYGRSIDAFILSFPKCGRTWLRMMLAKVFELHFGLDNPSTLNSNYLVDPRPGIPLIKIIHDDKPHLKTPADLRTDKSKYQGTKVILLIRDLRDALVSSYFQEMKRSKRYSGDLSSFIRCDRGGADSFIRFYNIWAENRSVPSALLLVRYEDLHANTEKELRRILNFLDLSAVCDDVVQKAVGYARFDNLRKIEVSEAVKESRKLQPGDRSDAESYKIRRGKVQGFVDYLSAADIEFLNQKMTQLSNFYGYHTEPRLPLVSSAMGKRD